MKSCIYVDKEKKSLQDVTKLISNIDELRLVQTCTNLDDAFTICKAQKISLLLIRRYFFPVSGEKVSVLKRIAKKGTRIVLITTKKAVAKDLFVIDMPHFALLPTSPLQLKKICLNALKQNDKGKAIPDIQTASLLSKN